MKRTKTLRFNNFLMSGLLVISAIILGITPANSQNFYPPFGNVGIGTVTPQQSLHVVGQEVLSTGFQSGFKFRNRGSASSADDWVWYSANNVARFWRNGYGDILGVTTGGNVGVGTLNPAARLEVNSSGLIAKFTNSSLTGDRTALIDIQNGQNILWRYGVGGLNNGLGINNGQFYIERFGIGSVLTMTTNGNVGMGTTVPEQKLHVVGTEVLSTGIQSGFKFRNRGSASNADDWVWYSAGNVARFWRAGPGDLMGVTTSGNLGVGTIAPEQKLHVVGTEVLSTGIQSGFKFRNRGSATSADDWVWYSAGNIARLWRSGPGDLMYINTAGNVGIGSAPVSTYKLAVCGRIRATAIRINTGWCDYVFEKDYKLMPLNEVEQYINANKHLPDVPSAAEVEKDGIELGEMNATLLRKIEELTLHMIDMKKQNDILKNRLDQLTIQASKR